MKKYHKTLGVILCLVFGGVMLTACGETQTLYNIISTTKKYESEENSVSGAEVDAEIILDAEFDEDFYTDRNWLVAYKNFSGKENYDGHSLGTRTAIIRSTAYIAKKGVLLAFDIDEGYDVSYSNKRGTANNSGIEINFALGGNKSAMDNLFEIDLTAHGDLQARNISNKFGASSYEFYDKWTYETYPNWKIKLKGGTIESGNCTGYAMELYLPYSMFGATSRPDEIYLNPGIITPHSATDNGRDRYDIGGAQCPNLHPWGAIGGLRFGKNGFISNKITIQSEGGTVTEQFGRDWFLHGDDIVFTLKPEEGKRLTSIMVNGKEMKDSVRLGKFKLPSSEAMDKIEIIAKFEQR